MNLWPQWLATSEVFLMALMVGATAGWLSPIYGRLSRPGPPFEATKEQTTWLAAIHTAGQPIGAILSTVAAPLIGSKHTVYLCGFIFLIEWTVLIYAESIGLVYISLLCGGIGMGVLFSAYPLYIGEICNPKIRGRLVGLVVQGLMIGATFGNIMGILLDPWVYALINLVPVFIYLVSFPFIPNTPHHLIRRNKTDAAAKSVEWYTRNIDSSKVVESISNFLAASPQISYFKTLSNLKSPVNRKTLLMLGTMFIIIHLFGAYTIMVYFEIILMSVEVNVMSPAAFVTIMMALGIPATGAAMYTNDKFGRTIMLLSACILIALTLTAVGIHFVLLESGYTDRNLQWITIISLCIYRCCLSIGFFTVIPTLVSEMFAPNVKIVCSCICLIIMSVSTFFSQKFFVFFVELLTYKYVFFILAAVHVLVGIYAKTVIPETKGKSLEEIQAILNKTPLPEESR